MKVFTTAISTLVIAAASMTSINATAGMSQHMETALIDTCKAAMSNQKLRLQKTLKEYRLEAKTVALGVVCNGSDIIAFAEQHGAEKTARHLNKKVGESTITDIANVTKYEVTFPVSPK